MAIPKIPYITEERLEQFATEILEKVNIRIDERFLTEVTETSGDKHVASAKAVYQISQQKANSTLISSQAYVDERILTIDTEAANSENVILTDTATGVKYLLTVENGVLRLIEFSNPDDTSIAFIVSIETRSMIGYGDTVENLVIPETFTGSGGTVYKVTEITTNTFADCSNLKTVIIPDTVSIIGYSAFARTGLSSIRIPNSVTIIGDAVFNGCTNLTSVILPNGITTIPKYTFQKCSGLTTITIPGTITNIDLSAFDGCTSLTTINFRGSKEQWDSITIGNNNTVLNSATKVYNYTE